MGPKAEQHEGLVEKYCKKHNTITTRLLFQKKKLGNKLGHGSAARGAQSRGGRAARTGAGAARPRGCRCCPHQGLPRAEVRACPAPGHHLLQGHPSWAPGPSIACSSAVHHGLQPVRHGPCAERRSQAGAIALPGRGHRAGARREPVLGDKGASIIRGLSRPASSPLRAGSAGCAGAGLWKGSAAMPAAVPWRSMLFRAARPARWSRHLKWCPALCRHGLPPLPCSHRAPDSEF